MSRMDEALYRRAGIKLNEAKNPDNEYINSIIRKAYDIGHLSREDYKILRDAGYKIIAPRNNEGYKILSPNGSYVYLDNGYGQVEMPDQMFWKYYDNIDKFDNMDYHNYMQKHTERQDAKNNKPVDDISDFALAKDNYNKQKKHLSDLENSIKDTQLTRIADRRSDSDIRLGAEKELQAQNQRVAKAKEEKNAILRKHGINPREALDLNEMALGEMSSINKSRVVPTHIEYNNVITPRTFKQIISKNVDKGDKGLKVIEGTIQLLKNDFETDLQDNPDRSSEVIAHYNRYIDAAISVLNSNTVPKESRVKLIPLVKGIIDVSDTLN